MRYRAVNIATDYPVPLSSGQQGIEYMYYPRIRCMDCPGKTYTPGPGTDVKNFEVHLKNRIHREKVNERVHVRRLHDARTDKEGSGVKERNETVPASNATLNYISSDDPDTHVSYNPSPSLSATSNSRSDYWIQNDGYGRVPQSNLVVASDDEISKTEPNATKVPQLNLVLPSDGENSETEPYASYATVEHGKSRAKVDDEFAYPCMWVKEGRSCGKEFRRLSELQHHYERVNLVVVIFRSSGWC